ncbi:amidohydrolase family protein [Luteibacter sp. ME-Dv--P-043b]|jgi:cytosine/adenosine deaminase-related metal-dependent hydrolase|uniref:amidohydrolase family protein n=1 Tax=Luteibacter sp. ME-Dv--P-043b TaxID=3040291 RepID=UPI0025543FD8|nr:amidohydrolase family protein [Luteibacter sp. ME-Dv--P-043b]
MTVTRRCSDVDLRGAVTVSPEGVSRLPMGMRAGRVVIAAGTTSYRVDLRDHLVFPGLINAHDHLHINGVPPLQHAAPFPNSYAWIEAFQAHFADPAVAAALAVPKAARLRHGALKNLLAGTTFVAHHDPAHAVFDAEDFPVGVLRGFGWSYALGGPDYGPPVNESFAACATDRPWMIHLAEGTDEVAGSELTRLDALGCLASHTVLIHGVGLGADDVDRVIDAGAAVVWCPSSNRALLGRTLDPHRLHEAGRLALGTDSRVSGSRDLLEELRVAGSRDGLAASSLLALVTTDAARILRTPGRGELVHGAHADMVIVEDRGGPAARSLLNASRAELRAVVRGGLPRIADPDFADWFDAAGVETVAVTLDGRPKLLDRTLADPAVLALEPGLARVEARSRQRAC